MSMICAETLYEFGEEAVAAVAESRNNDSLEKVVEANTLLSGIGFESGGLAMAHPLALAYTRINRVHNNYLHGEIVAISTMAQLALEESTDMHKSSLLCACWFTVHLGQLSMSPDNLDELDILAEVTMTNPNAHHMPIKLSHSLIKQSILDAHHVGVKISDEVGDQAYGAFIIKFRQAARQLVARTLAGLSSPLHNAPASTFIDHHHGIIGYTNRQSFHFQ